MNQSVTIADIKDELEIITSRSGGSGGQHVNKVETKVMLKWNVKESKSLDDIQKKLVLTSHKNKLTKNEELVVVSDSKRSQLRNKEIATKKMGRLLAQAFLKKKRRVPTQPSKAAKRQRLLTKKKLAEKKKLRKRVF
ncbi:MAG: alternative ribosome rescue aminoacyl-tRNA hydrolase ArfB [Cyclobacteriaceae bacterium]